MDYLIGTVEEIIFYSPHTGYTVCRFVLEDGPRITIVGLFPPVSPGEMLKVQGKWEMNRRYGRQFRVENFSPVLPSSAKGIEKYLSSGLIKGIGPVMARRIVKKFGSRTIDILSENPHKLEEISGIGAQKIQDIKKSWAKHEEIRELIMFLQEHNISTHLATKIYQHYGKKSFQILKENPYQAALDVWGIGFKTADQMALKLGMSPTSPQRVKAFIRYLLEKDIEQGHVFSLFQKVAEGCSKELQVSGERIEKALEDLEKENLVKVEKTESGRALYLPFFYKAEEEVVDSIQKLSSFLPLSSSFDIHKAMVRSERELSLCFSPTQKEAIKECFQRKILVITGGPGTGKTTIIKTVVDIFHDQGQRVLLAAPTGRAAKRLSEATHKEGKTLHRILEFNPKLRSFRRNENNPLTGEALIVDEFSMVDLPLLYHLLKAVPPWMRLILVGDKDQLPSVGPGNLLRDIIDSGKVRVIKLDKIFRQERGSLIVYNAHRVNQGKSLVYPQKGDKDSDFYFIPQEDEQRVFQIVMKLCALHIPRKLHLNPLSPLIQVISPMYRGTVGVDNLNTELQNRLNPGRRGLKLGNREIRIGDKVMQIKNNYEKEVFNGDIGTVAEVDPQSFRVRVNYEERLVAYEKEELNELTLAYAISVHKSQGSEYQAVVLPLLTQHYIMLQRNLFYTALSRARRLSVIIGSFKALHIAIKNNKPVQRNCLLKEKLSRRSSSKAGQ